ncbi:MAG: D-alanyl-D-alanine carboxypeptidase/D-alanyl-D-alanine-endopeptidase [Candidatus Cryptobacteroides sp.]
MKRHLLLIFNTIVILIAGSGNVYAQGERLQKEAEALASDPVFSRGAVGICVRTSSGKEIVSVNADKMLLPASNMKLITTGAALHKLGSGFRFKTRIGYDGEIRSGVLHGNLYIIGGGDPTLGSKDSIATPIEQTFRQWYRMLSDAGIKKIDGHIIGDGRWFDGPAEEATWLWEDLGTYYGTGTTGLMFYENMMSFSAVPGAKEGDPVDIRPYYPETPWMDYQYSCTTGAEGTGDRLYMFTSDLAPVACIRGTLGCDKGRKRIDCSNKYPEYTCAWHFKQYLKKQGLECRSGAGDFRLEKEWMDDRNCRSITVIGQTESPELSRIAFETNHVSNNVFAETFLRTLGKMYGGSAEYGIGAETLAGILSKDLGVDVSKGIFIKDGSGLSRCNLVSPDFLCRFLDAMTQTECFGDYLSGLPRPGGNGTLSYNLKNYPEALKERIRMKSGSMNGVRCYSGYILPTDGGEMLIFSIMVNNCTSPNWKVNPMLDRFIAGLAGYGE